MARIRSLRPVASTSSIHPTEVDAEWALVRSVSGDYFQIATFGSDTRKSHKKVSQTLQVDHAVAQQLVDALITVFPGLKVGR